MPSEKSRYLNCNRGPIQPYHMGDFISRLPAIGADRLAKMLAERAETDKVLSKILSVTLAIQESIHDISQVTDALNYAIHLSEFVYRSEGGYEMILDEIFLKIDALEKCGKVFLAQQIAKYTLKKGIEMQEQLEDDFSWNCRLEKIKKWLVCTTGVTP